MQLIRAKSLGRRLSEISFTPLLLALALLLATGLVWAQAETQPQELDDTWPKTISGDDATYTVYQPQIESWDGFELGAHSAIARLEEGAEQPTYGVVAFTTRTRVDKVDRVVTFDRLRVKTTRFPSSPDGEAEIQREIQETMAGQVRTIGLDRAEAALKAAEAQLQSKKVPVKNDPPKILFRSEATLLVLIDGEPVFRDVDGTSYQRLINTRPLILRDKKKGGLYLHLMDGWMTAKSVEGPWSIAKKAPRKIEKAQKAAVEVQTADLMEGDGHSGPKPTLAKGPVPRILVATVPTEVLIFDGQPNFVPLDGADLLYADNTSGNVFRSMEDSKLYVLVSGRWFRSESETGGTWSYVAQSDLPADFTAIPDDSAKENVKASVAGTAQSQEALIADAIPQMADVDPKSAKFEAVYDGEPKFAQIEGTSLRYATNSPATIIEVDADRFYALHDAVWFVGPTLNGPWAVATNIPAEIYSIPASSPVHNATYVKVYHSDPDVVVVGYTPGYYGTCVVDGVVVYGTGYRYNPWVGSHWYGAPVTYGAGVGITYSPWGGWAFTFGVGWSWGYWGSPWWGPYPSPWWGPYSYYPYHYPYYYGGVAYGPGGSAAIWGPGGWAGTTGNVYHRWGNTNAVTRTSGGYNSWTGNGWRNQVGASYNSRTGTLAAGQRAAVGNVYTGDYAYGGRGVVTNERTGRTAAGRSATIGNANTGREATARQGVVGNPRTGDATRVGSVRTDDGGAVRVGDEVFGTKDGNVYRRGDGGWEQVQRNGNWRDVPSRSTREGLDGQRAARSQGANRSAGVQRSRSAARSWPSSRGSLGGSRSRGGGGRRRF